jgi:hypothetical protein
LDSEFVRYWSSRYEAKNLRDLERQLLTTTRLAIKNRGYLTVDELVEVAKWKSRRALGTLTRNEADVEAVTRIALAPDTPEQFRHRILCILSGVGHPMASAILTVWDPEAHTVYDYRVVEALQELHKLNPLPCSPAVGDRRHMPGYWTFLQPYRKIAKSVGVSHRDLDRALWKWDQAGTPPGPRSSADASEIAS